MGFRWKPAGEILPNTRIVGSSPILAPVWGAGLSFQRGHRILRAPYDCCTPFMFDGEEFAITVRSWTNGYDFYAFIETVAFHPYARKSKQHMFWENSAQPVEKVGVYDTLYASTGRVMAMAGKRPD